MRTQILTTGQPSTSSNDSGPAGAANRLAAARRGLRAAELDLRNAIAQGCDPSAARALAAVQLATVRLDGGPAHVPAA